MTTGLKPPRIVRSISYVDSHFNESGIRLSHVAQHVGCSPAHLSRQLRKHTGAGFRDLLSRARIGAAKQLLLAADVSVKSVAFDVGYSHASAFTRDFGRMVGMSPSRWRASNCDWTAPPRNSSMVAPASAAWSVAAPGGLRDSIGARS